MKLNLIYITTKDKDEARKIGEELINTRLAACINIIDGMNSIYWWEGKIESNNETILIAKTRQPLVKKLIKKVKSIHNYKCPCIVSLPIVDGNKDYLDWLQNETEKRG